MPTHTVFLVPSVSHAMKGERELKRAGIPHKLMPVPRSLGSDCGVCLRVDAADRARAEETLRATGLEIAAIHDIEQTARYKEMESERTDDAHHDH